MHTKLKRIAPATIAITERVLIRRINRKLKPQNEQLKTCRSARWETTLGRHFVVDVMCNAITGMHVDLEAWGRELAVLRPSERLSNAA